MRPADTAAAVSILECWNMAPRPPSAECPDPERAVIDVAKSFVAALDDKVVGICSWIDLGDHRAETASMAVAPEVRGTGIGTLLQQARLEEMRTCHVRQVRTETDRPETIRWLVEKFGFRIVGKNPKKHSFSLNEVSDWTVLELDLAS